MADSPDPTQLQLQIQRLQADLAREIAARATAEATLDLVRRQVDDFRAQNYRLDAQYTESRISRAIADERAAAAREAAARAEGRCGCSCGCSGAAMCNCGQQTTPQPSGGVSGGPTNPPTTPVATGKLIFDKVVMGETPQDGTWLMWFQATTSGGASCVFHIPNQTYQDDGIEIDMNQSMGPVAAGDTINFKLQLDDDESTVGGNDAEDKSAGQFTASASGSKTFTFDNWVYTLYWHMA